MTGREGGTSVATGSRILRASSRSYASAKPSRTTISNAEGCAKRPISGQEGAAHILEKFDPILRITLK